MNKASTIFEQGTSLTCDTAKDDYLFAMQPFVLEYNTYGSQCAEGALPETEECLALAEDGYDYITTYYDVVASYADLGTALDLDAATSICADNSDPDCAAALAYDTLTDAAALCNAAFDDDCITARDGVWFTWTLACNAFDVYRATCDDEGITVSTADFCAEDGNDELYDNCQAAADQLEFCGVGDFATPEEAVLALDLDAMRTFIHSASHPEAVEAETAELIGLTAAQSSTNHVVAVGLVVGMVAGLVAGFKSGQRKSYAPI